MSTFLPRLIRFTHVLPFALIVLPLQAQEYEFLPTFQGEVARARAAQSDSPPAPLMDIAFYVQYLPGTANASGQFGAFFKTRTTIFNISTTTSTVTVSLYGPNGKVAEKDISVPAAAAVTYQNLLQDVFGYTGAGGVVLREKTSSKDMAVSSEVYVEGPNGRFSTATGGLLPSDDVTTSTSMLEVSAGIFVTSQSRANAACMNTWYSTSQVSIGIYNAAGNLLTTVALSIPGYGWAQKPVEVSVDGGIALWKTTTLGQYCYLTNVDNTSNDGSFVRTSTWVP